MKTQLDLNEKNLELLKNFLATVDIEDDKEYECVFDNRKIIMIALPKSEKKSSTYNKEKIVVEKNRRDIGSLRNIISSRIKLKEFKPLTRDQAHER